MEGNGGSIEQVRVNQPEGGGIPSSSKDGREALPQAGKPSLQQEYPSPSSNSQDVVQQGSKAEEQESNQPFNMTQVLQQEFGLTPEQLSTLRDLAQKEGINLDQFSEEDLGNKEKMQKMLDLLAKEEMKLSDQQKKNLEDIQQQLQQADQPLTEEQMQENIKKRITQLEQRIAELKVKKELTPDEEKELSDAEETLKNLNDVFQFKPESSDPSKRFEEKREMLKQRIKQYGTYTTIGMGLLIFVFAWRGFKETNGGQRGGIMG